MKIIERQHREEIAKFSKNKAVLEQQVELLTIQLSEASEREKNLKKTYNTMIQALQQKNQHIEEDMLNMRKVSSESNENKYSKSYSPSLKKDKEKSPMKKTARDFEQETEEVRRKLKESELVINSQKMQI